MSAILIGVVAGVAIGLLYLVGAKRQVRRTLASSVLLGIFVGILVELARRPLFTAIFAGVATIFLAEFIRWVLGSLRRKS
jgi:xanthosine utilization system XapX-like protein